jgi:peptide/nickel transport system permease protein
MEKVYEQKLDEENKVKEEESTAKKIISWVFKNIKFLLIPGSRLEELSKRQFEYEKIISKRKFIRRLKSTLTILGIVLIFIIVSIAVFAPWLSPYTFEECNGVYSGWWDPPSPEHPLGKTYYGRDVLGRALFGARSSLTIALPAILFSVAFGVIFGIISGFYGGWVDTIIMRIADIMLAFPSLVFSLVLIAILGRETGPRVEWIMLSWGILGIPAYARLIRASVLQARALPYVEAAKVAGAGSWRIMFKHIMPNTIQPIIISFTFDIGGVILSLAGLAFLGYSDPRLIEWGNDINIARSFLYEAPLASLIPGLMILLTVLGFMLVGDGLRDALDPRLRNI